MFKIFRKNKATPVDKNKSTFEIELTASVLAYEVARSDGGIEDTELKLLIEEIKKVAQKVNKSEESILNLIKEYSTNSISFHDFIEDINKNFSKEEKLSLVSFLWSVAYADKILEVNEERLIRRIASLIKIKDVDVLRLKHQSKTI